MTRHRFRTYDDWKTTNPDDENLGPIGECDACGRRGSLVFSITFGIETWSCEGGCEPEPEYEHEDKLD